MLAFEGCWSSPCNEAAVKPVDEVLQYEYLIGEPLRETEKIEVLAPIRKVIYELCKALQWRTMGATMLTTVLAKRQLGVRHLELRKVIIESLRHEIATS